MHAFQNITVRFAAFLALCCALTGCATWSKHGVALEGQKLRVAVLPVRFAFEVTKLKRIESVTNEVADGTNRQAQIAAAVRGVESHITDSIQRGLTNSYFFVPVPRAEVERALADAGITNTSARLTTNQVQQLGSNLNAQTVLQTKIVGYGAIKKSWLWWLTGWAFAESAFDGLVVGGASGSPLAGIGLAAETFGQEMITTFGGVYVFDRIYTPVILESELFSAKDGKAVWSDMSLDSSNKKGLKKYSEAEQKKKEIRLRTTENLAVQDMLDSLNEKAAKNILYGESAGRNFD